MNVIKNATLAINGPGDIKPDYGYFPWTDTLADIAGGVSANVVIIVVICALVGVGGLLAGKLSSSNMMSKIGWGVLITSLVCIVLAVNAGQIADWATQQTVINSAMALTA